MLDSTLPELSGLEAGVVAGQIIDRRDGIFMVQSNEDDSIYCCAALENGGQEYAIGDVVILAPVSLSFCDAVVLGRVRRPTEGSHKPAENASLPSTVPDSLLIEAREELTLRVGEGSITIRADGKILIKGKDLVSHAQRVNRIRGGSVAIN